MPDTSAHPLRDGLAKFWAPVPWLFEAAIVFQVVRHKYCEAGVIAGLLVFNAALAYFQEGRAQATLAALKSRLARSGLRRTCICWMGPSCWISRCLLANPCRWKPAPAPTPMPVHRYGGAKRRPG